MPDGHVAVHTSQFKRGSHCNGNHANLARKVLNANEGASHADSTLCPLQPTHICECYQLSGYRCCPPVGPPRRPVFPYVDYKARCRLHSTSLDTSNLPWSSAGPPWSPTCRSPTPPAAASGIWPSQRDARRVLKGSCTSREEPTFLIPSCASWILEGSPGLPEGGRSCHSNMRHAILSCDCQRLHVPLPRQ